MIVLLSFAIAMYNLFCIFVNCSSHYNTGIIWTPSVLIDLLIDI